MTPRKVRCDFSGFGQWDCDDAPCESEATFQVTEHGDDKDPKVCVRHLGYAVAHVLDGTHRTVAMVTRLGVTS